MDDREGRDWPCLATKHVSIDGHSHETEAKVHIELSNDVDDQR